MGNFEGADPRKMVKAEGGLGLPVQMSSSQSISKNDELADLPEPGLSRNQSIDLLPDMGNIGRTYSTFSFIADK